MVAAISASNNSFAAAERLHPSKNFVGTWGGSWNGKEKFSITVTDVKAGKANVVLKHGTVTERGTGTIEGTILTYGDIQFATRNGKQGVAIAKYGTVEKKAVLAKAVPAAAS